MKITNSFASRVILLLTTINLLQIANAKSLLLNKFEGVWNGKINNADLSKQNGTFVMDYKNSNGYLQAKDNQHLPINFEGALKFNLWDDNIQLQKGEAIVRVQQFDQESDQQIVKSCSLNYEVEFLNSQDKNFNKINLAIHLYSSNDEQEICYLDINLTGSLELSSLLRQCIIVFTVFSLFYIVQLIGNKKMREHIVTNKRNAKKILLYPFVINQIQNQAMISSICYQLYILLQQIGFDGTILLYLYIGCHIPMQFSDLFIFNELLKAKYPSKFEKIMKLQLIPYLLLVYVGLMIQYGLLFAIEFYFAGNFLYELTLIATFIPQLIYNFKFYSIKLNPMIIFSIMGTKTFYILYVRGCPYNILEQESSFLYSSLIVILVACQIALFVLQYKKGPQNLMPQRFQQKVNQMFQSECVEICQICQETFKDQQINNSENFSGYINAGCGHYFHRECLKQYVQVQQECPLCKVELDI